MSKFDFSKTINKLQKTIKDEKRSTQFGLGNSLQPISKDPKDYVVMPDWFQSSYGVLGLRFGHIVQVAGDSDTGKTTISLESIKRAQEQGYGVIYCETEGKTGPEDLSNAGIDPNGVIVINSSVTEEVFDNINKAWDLFFKDYPEEKLLLVIDSYGNTVSMRDSEIDMTQANSQPGGAAKINRQGLNSLIARIQQDPVSILVINYTYDNMGSPGKTNAGGKALNFFSMLTIQTQRISWVEKTVKGQKVRAGAKVKWTTFKNHYAKSLKDDDGNAILLPKSIELSITGDGFALLEGKDD